MITPPDGFKREKIAAETSACETNLSAVLIHGTATTHPEKKTHRSRKM
jgi:hypothetical protein